MVAQKTGAAEQRRSGRECAQASGFGGTDFRRRPRATVEVEEAVSLDLRNPVEILFEFVGGAQRGEA